VGIVEIEDGYDFRVLVLDGSWVVRIPRRPGVFEQLHVESAWLLNVPFPHWEVDDELRRRARFYHRLGPWFEAHHGVFTSRPAHVETGLRGIRSRL
jgi:hypothetical protein